MGKYAFIDNIFGTDHEEETEANDAFDEEEDDYDDEPDDEADDEDDASAEDDAPEEDDASLAQLDKAYRKLRARVRALTDLSELRTIRGHQTEALSGRLTPMARLRTQDIVEEIDARVTDIRASRGPRGS